MFERFTEEARQVVVFAQGEAHALHHDAIDTEHLLLGLLREEGALAACVLAGMGIGIDHVRGEVTRIVGPGTGRTTGQIPFTPRAKKVLELALREALSLGHDFIATEHILLGLVRQDEGVAAVILEGAGVGPDRVRAILAVELGVDVSSFGASPIGRRARRPRRRGGAAGGVGIGVGRACWEYRIEQRQHLETTWLDELGADGWELVAVQPEAAGLELIFKRRRFPGSLRAAG